MKKKFTAEERERRCRVAFESRGVDYDEFKKSIERKKNEMAIRKIQNAERNMYHPNHEDNIQFGCCCPDTLAFDMFQANNSFYYE